MPYSARFLEERKDNLENDPSVFKVNVGSDPSSGHQRARVLVNSHDKPILLLTVFVEVDKDGFIVDSCFCEILNNDEYVVIISGQHVHIVDISLKQSRSFFLGDYVGHLYAVPDYLENNLSEHFLVATYCYVFLIDIIKGIVWKSERCAIDGVIINNVYDGIIYGEGEWDPPGGWLEFRLSLSDGSLIT